MDFLLTSVSLYFSGFLNQSVSRHQMLFMFIALSTCFPNWWEFPIDKCWVFHNVQIYIYLILLLSTALFSRKIGFMTPNKEYRVLQYLEQLNCFDHEYQCSGQLLYCRKVEWPNICDQNVGTQNFVLGK